MILFFAVVDPCETIDENGEPPCQNGGVCNMTQPGNFECSCPIGYEGGETQTSNFAVVPSDTKEVRLNPAITNVAVPSDTKKIKMQMN